MIRNIKILIDSYSNIEYNINTKYDDYIKYNIPKNKHLQVKIDGLYLRYTGPSQSADGIMRTSNILMSNHIEMYGGSYNTYYTIHLSGYYSNKSTDYIFNNLNILGGELFSAIISDINSSSYSYIGFSTEICRSNSNSTNRGDITGVAGMPRFQLFTCRPMNQLGEIVGMGRFGNIHDIDNMGYSNMDKLGHRQDIWYIMNILDRHGLLKYDIKCISSNRRVYYMNYLCKELCSNDMTAIFTKYKIIPYRLGIDNKFIYTKANKDTNNICHLYKNNRNLYKYELYTTMNKK